MTISKSKLIPLLVEQGFIVSEKHNVCYEAYGRKVRAYIRVANFEERKRLQSFLRAQKITHFPDYWPGAAVVEASVSYFKADGWDQ